MSAHPHPDTTPSAKKTSLVLAEFQNAKDVVHAAEMVRDAGYTRWDTHTPFPIHGMDRAMGLSDSKLGWISVCGALAGMTTAVSIGWYMNGYDYPLVIGGKPPFALPALVPVIFELTILFTAFGTVFGMFHLNRLPRHHHPVFESDRFRAATDDKFFVSIEAADPKFNVDSVKSLFDKAHASNVEVLEEEV